MLPTILVLSRKGVSKNELDLQTEKKQNTIRNKIVSLLLSKRQEAKKGLSDADFSYNPPVRMLFSNYLISKTKQP